MDRSKAIQAAYDAVQRAMSEDYREGDQIEWVFQKPIDVFLNAMDAMGWELLQKNGGRDGVA